MENETSFKNPVLEMMARRDRERKLIKERNQRDRREKSELEGIDYFDSIFDKKVIEIGTRFDTLQPGGDSILMQEEFTSIAKDLQELQRYFTSSTIFLNDHKIQRCQNIINHLVTKSEERKARIVPKKKFGFKNKPAVNQQKTETKVVEVEKESKQKTFEWTDAEKKNLVIVLNSDKTNNQDLTFKDMENCVIIIRGHPGSLQMSKMKNCLVICNPVARSIFGDNCKSCTFSFACQQLRLHSSTSCTIYLFVTSRAIIEDCTEIYFAPCAEVSDDFENNLKLSGLDGSVNNWENIASAPKRFYKSSSVLFSDGKYEITLDQRKLKTPKGTLFTVESEPLALAIAHEWNSQKETIERSRMMLTALSNTVIDNPNNLTKLDIINYLLSYAETDTILFHNEAEADLYKLQTDQWDPIIEWFNKRYDTDLKKTVNISPPVFPSGAKMQIAKYLQSHDMTALHGIQFAVETVKSVILAFACIDRFITPEKAVLLSRLEEEFQLGHWGRVEWAHDLNQQDLQMAQNSALIMRIMASSITVAEKAGEVIRDIMSRGELGVVDKGLNTDFDPQTEADRSSQKCIIGSLSKQYSKLKIIGEEGATDLSNVPKELIINGMDENFLSQYKCPDSFINITENDLCVWVDPLDGTSEYVHGFLEHVTVLIGISFREMSIGGVIHQPYFKCAKSGKLGRTIWGMKELGTGGYTSKKAPENKFIITTTRSHSNALVQTTLDSIRPDDVLRVGGCGFKVLQLLEGKAHCYVFASPGCKKWDTCAPEAILEADGGVLTDILGKHYSYGPNVEYANKTGVLATARHTNHQDLLEKIPDHVKNKLNA
ncbi:CLUMA_CG014299, isoform A [Clunio marinus]|uniref:3'(2'),5'-bisphosphate nucleotidase 1 n=1 Tax=Clunio marinus TaxID=568069 RepID=A0A1J1IM24_9DIPT|nr:CLUMA_CG014299, isoform A [Clunio marinus]